VGVWCTITLVSPLAAVVLQPRTTSLDFNLWNYFFRTRLPQG
jgi:hypothetical protein